MAKSIADKADMGYVMSRVSDKTWTAMLPNLRQAVRQGLLDEVFVYDENYRPTHVLDIYKMRRGRYKNVRVWVNLHLGTGRRTDLFITSADNQPIGQIVDLFSSAKEISVDWND